MAREKSPVEILFDDLVKVAVTAILKPAGFRKSALNFHRRHKETVQVVNLQVSQGSDWNEKHFYVNVGIAFDDVCRLVNIDVLDKPKEYECNSRGMHGRLETLIDELPKCWSVSVDEDCEAVVEHLKSSMGQLVEELEIIDGVRAYRSHRWFDRFRPKKENAQILYLLGDMDGAWDEVNALCTLFADRNAINQPEWWVEELGLQQLADRC